MISSRIFGYPLLRAALFAIVTGSPLFLASCEGTASGTETGNRISLKGRVIDKDNAPVSGIVARLANAGLSDTTDAAGRFLIRKDTSVQDPDGVVDTLLFLQEGRRVADLDIERWVDSLPDVKLMQRGFSGSLDNDPEIGKVEGVLTHTGTGDKAAQEFFFNRPAREYSGYFSIPSGGAADRFEVYLNVYDTAGFLIGRSDTIAFNGLAGDITIPYFDAKNVKLAAVAGEDTTLAPGDTLRLQGKGSTPPGTEIVEYAWKLPGDAGFKSALGGSASYIVPLPYDTNIIVELRITNSAGARAIDTQKVKVINRLEHLFRFPMKKVSDSSDATNRISPWVLEFKGKMWIIGGDYNHLTTGDIWSSDNGSDWQLVNDSTPFALGGATGFIGPQIVVFQDKLWAIEGSKVWSSPDGVAWTMITDKPGYPVRLEFKAVVLNKRLVLFGGIDPATARPRTDVWTSEDGFIWVRETESDQTLLVRGGYPAVVFGNEIWMANQPDNKLASALHSPDAIVWSQSYSMAGYISATFEDNLLALRPPPITEGSHLYYRSLKSGEWKTLNTPVPLDWDYLTGATLAEFKGRIWLVGGSTHKGVWTWGE